MIIFSTKKGYTLLFAVILASIVLSIAAFILSISRKQIILTAASRDSTIAIYAVDSGLQCAMENYTGSLFSTTTPFTFSCYTGNTSVSFTDLEAEQIVGMGFSNNHAVYGSQAIPVYLPNGSCAKVSFTSGVSTYSGRMRVVIDSLGYSLGDSTSGCPKNNPKTVERAVRLVYD